MDVIEEVLRMPHAYGRSQREIGSACGLSVGAVNGLLLRAVIVGLGWPSPLPPPPTGGGALRACCKSPPSGLQCLPWASIRPPARAGSLSGIGFLPLRGPSTKDTVTSREPSDFCNRLVCWKQCCAERFLT